MFDGTFGDPEIQVMCSEGCACHVREFIFEVTFDFRERERGEVAVGKTCVWHVQLVSLADLLRELIRGHQFGCLFCFYEECLEVCLAYFKLFQFNLERVQQCSKLFCSFAHRRFVVFDSAEKREVWNEGRCVVRFGDCGDAVAECVVLVGFFVWSDPDRVASAMAIRVMFVHGALLVFGKLAVAGVAKPWENESSVVETVVYCHQVDVDVRVGCLQATYTFGCGENSDVDNAGESARFE